MRSRISICLISVLIVVFATGNLVLANGLPTPSFYTEFRGAPQGRDYYVILFADDAEYVVDFSVGIHGEIMSEDDLKETNIPAFLDSYKDPDGMTLTKNPIVRCSGVTNNGYFVPSYETGNTYRFLIYWDDTGEYKITDRFTLEHYDTRFGVDISSEGATLPVKDITAEYGVRIHIPGMIIRLVFTVTCEFLLALAFWFHRKKELLTVLITNFVSNLLANIISFFFGYFYIMGFLLIEAVVIAVEFFIYRKVFDKDRTTTRILTYSIVANLTTASTAYVIFLIDSMILAYMR